MAGFAPRNTLLRAAARIQRAREEQSAGSVIIAGIVYACDLFIGDATPEQDSRTGNVHIVQRGSVKILKSRLPQPPKREAVLKISGVDYIVESCGAAPLSVSWNIKFYRLPPQ